MFLYLVQHAEAQSKEEDPARDLTEKGRQDILKVANFVGNLNLAASHIFHSGKARAATTAQTLASSLKPPTGVADTTGLAPLDDPQIWVDRLAKKDEDIMLVGHLPHLARLAAQLITGDKENTVIHFKMGGLVCLRREEGEKWAVEWMIIPEMIL
jgi:phosphohistidine phosphatase